MSRHSAELAGVRANAGKMWDDKHEAWALPARNYPPAVALVVGWAEARRETRERLEADEASRVLVGWGWTR